ncbi:MAG: hypothetical protein GY697_10325 [Desulfobacterales bacterium]|nr:hypothetical protein [Desulfobacterales bacterium]
MADPISFKSAHEMVEIQGSVSAQELPVEVANTLPIPKKTESGLVILIIYYNETGPHGQRVVHPPHYAMTLDPATGDVLRFWACRPDDLGIVAPLKTLPGAGITPGMTGNEFFHLRLRFLDISAAVWQAYASGATQFEPQLQKLIAEYWQLFLRITKKEIAPFYAMSSPDYFQWLKTVTRS